MILALLVISGCSEVMPVKISSTVFNNNGPIPPTYTCDADDISPPLVIKDVPRNAETLVLIVEDPDAPVGTWVHWVVWNIPVTENIQENSVPGTEGVNDFRKNSWGGPCPPSGTHRYFFKVYALDTQLKLPNSATKADVKAAMKGHIVGKGELVGLYTRR